MHSFDEVIRCPIRKTMYCSMALQGWGHYVGTYMAWGVNNTGWWGEGEIKFFMDDDGEFLRSAALAPRITFAAPTTSRTRKRGATRSSTHLTPGCIRSFGLT